MVERINTWHVARPRNRREALKLAFISLPQMDPALRDCWGMWQTEGEDFTHRSFRRIMGEENHLFRVPQLYLDYFEVQEGGPQDVSGLKWMQ